ncbi:MAG TPA: Ig-like domain-containing protein [Polyangiaceae bacterium]|nr:Ig-like domain-containing protein [Polyangiaceae bacterium]
MSYSVSWIARIALCWALLTGCSAPSAGHQGTIGPAPVLLSASPEVGATDVYPGPVPDGTGERFTIRLTFSQPMQLNSEPRLTAGERALTPKVSWSSDRNEVELMFSAGFSGIRPLPDQTRCSLDLGGFEATDGTPLAARELVFTTGSYDALLNHSCGHTFFGPFATVAAAREPAAQLPNTSTTHTLYTVSLPEADAESRYGGVLRLRFAASGKYRLYFDVLPEVSWLSPERDSDSEAVVPQVPSPAPQACPGIAHQLDFTAEANQDLFLGLRRPDAPQLSMLIEQVP